MEYNNKTNPVPDLIESTITNVDFTNPSLMTNYNNKNNNFFKNNTVKNNNNNKHKKVKSTFCFNETTNHEYINKFYPHNKKENYLNYYKDKYNSPIVKKTQTLNKNENENNIKSKKEHSIININININETNLYLGNQKKKSEKEKMYPKIVPKLDINSITKNNRVNSINGHTSKEKKAQNILHLNDLKNIYNNFTERNLIPKDSEDKNKVFINKKFKLMLGLKARNDKLVFQRNLNNRNIGINKVHLT